MEQRRHVQRPRPTEPREVRQAETPEPSALMEEVSDWGDAAREAMSRCERGADAEREVSRRHNTSGE